MKLIGNQQFWLHSRQILGVLLQSGLVISTNEGSRLVTSKQTKLPTTTLTMRVQNHPSLHEAKKNKTLWPEDVPVERFYNVQENTREGIKSKSRRYSKGNTEIREIRRTWTF